MPPDKKGRKPTDNRPSPQKVKAILAILDLHYPDARCSLQFNSPLELLIATILSAQCTDVRVNQVAPVLFKKYPTAGAYAEAPIEQIEEDIRSTGFFRNKARNIKACSGILHERFGGAVPADLDVLVTLPGIGRKTANVVLGNAFQIPGIVVDTHVARVSARLGLTSHKDPDKIEQDLVTIIPKEKWTVFSHQLIQLGRDLCRARKPMTSDCPLRTHCTYALEHSGRDE